MRSVRAPPSPAALKGLGGSGKCSEGGPQGGVSVHQISCWPRGEEGVTCDSESWGVPGLRGVHGLAVEMQGGHRLDSGFILRGELTPRPVAWVWEATLKEESGS